MLTRLTGVWLGLALLSGPAAPGQEISKVSKDRKVLVELFTSQGCNMCPAAEDLLARLEALGYGRDKVIPLAFHVDYFNKPWADPLSDRQYSSREWAYHLAFQARDSKAPSLYFTPMVMIDGRIPLSGYDASKKPEVQRRFTSALDQRLSQRLEATLAIRLETLPGEFRSGTLHVEARPSSARFLGREVLLGVAIYQETVTTAVRSGENAGKTLVEHNAVRRFQHQKIKLGQTGPTATEFALKLEDDWELPGIGVAIFLQDETSGAIYQADSIPWPAPATAVEPSTNPPDSGPAR
ncbi:DUF1223 domain-containing protein [soil metagenome]